MGTPHEAGTALKMVHSLCGAGMSRDMSLAPGRLAEAPPSETWVVLPTPNMRALRRVFESLLLALLFLWLEATSMRLSRSEEIRVCSHNAFIFMIKLGAEVIPMNSNFSDLISSLGWGTRLNAGL